MLSHNYVLILLHITIVFSSTTRPTHPTAQSRCTMTELEINCPYNTTYVEYEFGTRTVYWQIPLGNAPANGWSVVLFFQGSFFPADLAFWSYAGEPFGAYYQAHVVKNLLDNGYAVIAPNADLDGKTFWNTNVPPFDVDWNIAPDNYLMYKLFDLIQKGEVGTCCHTVTDISKFGPLDFKHMHATGISSGGYMTSRMAISCTQYFRSLVIESASYCICSGPLCYIPEDLPHDHPPTLFLHGELDFIVPIWTMWDYYDRLTSLNITTKAIVSDLATHQWIEEAPDAVYQWFNQFK